MDVPAMHLEQHERGIHVVWLGACMSYGPVRVVPE